MNCLPGILRTMLNQRMSLLLNFTLTRLLTVHRLTSPRLLLAGLDRHRASLEYFHVNSIDERSYWGSFQDDGFHGDEDSITSDYDPANDEHVALHEERQNKAWKEIKQEYIHPIDLHEFRALKRVSVHATSLLSAMNKADATDYILLSTVLPATQEVLSLRYLNFFSDWNPQLQFIYENDIGDVGGAQWNVDT
jgi:hypothetical protein